MIKRALSIIFITALLLSAPLIVHAEEKEEALNDYQELLDSIPDDIVESGRR